VADVGDAHCPTKAAAPLVSAAAPTGLGDVALGADDCVLQAPVRAAATAIPTITDTVFIFIFTVELII
jgi:hypothetical protein